MIADTKNTQLNIRTSRDQKARLTEAARLRNVSVSQFVLDESLQAADEILAEENLIRLSAEEYAWLMKRLEEPPREIPELRELFSRPSVFES